MGRLTKHDYEEPGSFARLQEAALSVADADAADEREYDAACARLRMAAVWYVAKRLHLLERILHVQVVTTVRRT